MALSIKFVRKVKFAEDKVTDQMVEQKINELRTEHATLAGVLERIHNMDLKETNIGLLGIDAME